MRSVTFAAGLILAASSGFAQQTDSYVPNPSSYLTLANGCVYGPNFYGAPNEWTLVYKQSGSTARCAQSVFGVSQQIGRTPVHDPETDIQEPAQTVTQVVTSPLPQPRRPRINPFGGFLVGVFR